MTGMPSGRPSEPRTGPAAPAPAHGDGPTGPSAPTGHTGLRDQIAEALYRHTMHHAAGGPARLLTRDETVLWENSLARADAVMPAVEAETAALRQRAEQAERERDEERAIRQQAEEIIAIAHDTSNRSEHERVRAVQRAETAERQHAEALDQIATERRGRLAAEAAARRACELADRAEMTADVIDPDGTRIQFAAVAVRDLRPALAIKQPKETPMPIDPGAYLRGIYKLDEPAPSKPTVKGTPDATPLDIAKEVQETLEALLPHLQGEHMRDLWHANDLMSELIERLEDER